MTCSFSSAYLPEAHGIKRHPPGPGRRGLADPGSHSGRSLVQRAQVAVEVSRVDTGGRPPGGLDPAALEPKGVGGLLAMQHCQGCQERRHLPSPDRTQQPTPQPALRGHAGLLPLTPRCAGRPLPLATAPCPRLATDSLSPHPSERLAASLPRASSCPPGSDSAQVSLCSPAHAPPAGTGLSAGPPGGWQLFQPQNRVSPKAGFLFCLMRAASSLLSLLPLRPLSLTPNPLHSLSRLLKCHGSFTPGFSCCLIMI